MKKSQILAALALAFALGVVAPVASTYAAIQSTTVSGTQSEKNDKIAKITEEANDLLAEADRIENYTDYKVLCGKFDCNSKFIEDLQNMAKAQLKDFNRGLGEANATNRYITRVATVIRSVDFKDAVKDKNLSSDSLIKSIPTFGNNYGTLEAAYSAVENVIALAKDNIKTLNDNYEVNDQTTEAKELYQMILWDLNYVGNGTTDTAADNAIYGLPVNPGTPAYNANSLLSFLNAALYDVFTGANGIPGFNIASYLTAIRNIDEDAYIDMVRNDGWHNTTDNNIEFAENVQLMIKTAKKLPKYGAACALLNAENNVKKIVSDGDQVDYTEAQGFIAAMKTAISNYRNGINPGTGNGNQGTGNGTNAGDDNKDDQKAPTTGILADAEGSASTTVAMVAGIATALTAAGAGVVAYRNARRSTRK